MIVLNRVNVVAGVSCTCRLTDFRSPSGYVRENLRRAGVSVSAVSIGVSTCAGVRNAKNICRERGLQMVACGRNMMTPYGNVMCARERNEACARE